MEKLQKKVINLLQLCQFSHKLIFFANWVINILQLCRFSPSSQKWPIDVNTNFLKLFYFLNYFLNYFFIFFPLFFFVLFFSPPSSFLIWLCQLAKGEGCTIVVLRRSGELTSSLLGLARWALTKSSKLLGKDSPRHR